MNTTLVLPDEIWIHIFSFLEIKDQAKCSAVCKKWRKITKKSSLLHTSIKERLNLESENSEFDWLKYISVSYSSLQNFLQFKSEKQNLLTYTAHSNVVTCLSLLPCHLIKYPITSSSSSSSSASSPYSHRFLATGSIDCLIRIWDLNNFKCLTEINFHTNGLSAIFWISESILLTAGWDKKVCLWEISAIQTTLEMENEQKTLDEFKTIQFPLKLINPVSFHADIHKRVVSCVDTSKLNKGSKDKRLLILSGGGGDGTIVVWVTTPPTTTTQTMSTTRKSCSFSSTSLNSNYQNKQDILLEYTFPYLDYITEIKRVFDHSSFSEKIGGSERKEGIFVVGSSGQAVLLQLNFDVNGEIPISVEALRSFIVTPVNCEKMISTSLQGNVLFMSTQGSRTCDTIAVYVNWEILRNILRLPVSETPFIPDEKESEAIFFRGYDIISQPKPHIRNLFGFKGITQGLAFGILSREMAHLGIGQSPVYRTFASSKTIFHQLKTQVYCFPSNEELENIWPNSYSIECSHDKLIIGLSNGTIKILDFYSESINKSIVSQNPLKFSPFFAHKNILYSLLTLTFAYYYPITILGIPIFISLLVYQVKNKK